MRRGRSTFNPHVSPMWGFEEEFLESDVMRRHGCFGGDGGVSAGTLQADVHRSNVEGGYGPVTEYDAEGWGDQDMTALVMYSQGCFLVPVIQFPVTPLVRIGGTPLLFNPPLVIDPGMLFMTPLRRRL